MTNKLLFLSLAILISLTSGCTNLGKQSLTPSAAITSQLNWHWQASGRLAISTSKDSNSGSFTWQQEGAEYAIQLSGPLGQGKVSINGQPFYVTLKEGKQQQEAASPEILFANQGWQLPLSNLVYWLQGQTAPSRVNWLAENKFEQDGWQVEWRKFSQVENQRLPSLLLVSSPELSLRLAINKWQLTN